jgi:hypothetical protein
MFSTLQQNEAALVDLAAHQRQHSESWRFPPAVSTAVAGAAGAASANNARSEHHHDSNSVSGPHCENRGVGCQCRLRLPPEGKLASDFLLTWVTERRDDCQKCVLSCDL